MKIHGPLRGWTSALCSGILELQQSFGAFLPRFRCFPRSGFQDIGQLLSSGPWPQYSFDFSLGHPSPGKRCLNFRRSSPFPKSSVGLFFFFGFGKEKGPCRSWVVRRSWEACLLYCEGVWGEWLAGKDWGREELERTSNWKKPRTNEAAHPLWIHALTPTEISVFWFVKIVWYQNTENQHGNH